MTDYASLEKLKERAADLGLELGVSAAPPGPELRRFKDWLEAGNHADMAWMSRDPERRGDATRVVEGARSVLSIAQSYFQGALPTFRDGQRRGRIARYALGSDYHDLLLGKVRELTAFIGDELARPYVDTGPVLEKPRAMRAGLGWVGKHTNAVSRRLGSWWFIGSVITRADYEPASDHEDHCGSCTACLEVCPTGAIDPSRPYSLDARLCISYLTIEHRGPIPVALREKLGTWIYGCDLCLDACPWNRFAQVSSEAGYHARQELVEATLEDMLGWDQATFSRIMKGSPIKRTKRRGLLRNVAVALGNAGDRGAIPTLGRCLSDEPEPLVRGHAAWALGQLGGPAARAALELARSDEDEWVRSEVGAALDRA